MGKLYLASITYETLEGVGEQTRLVHSSEVSIYEIRAQVEEKIREVYPDIKLHGISITSAIDLDYDKKKGNYEKPQVVDNKTFVQISREQGRNLICDFWNGGTNCNLSSKQMDKLEEDWASWFDRVYFDIPSPNRGIVLDGLDKEDNSKERFIFDIEALKEKGYRGSIIKCDFENDQAIFKKTEVEVVHTYLPELIKALNEELLKGKFRLIKLS